MLVKPVTTFLQNYATFYTFCGTFKVKYPVNGTKSFLRLSETGECEYGNVLLRYTQQFGNKMLGEWL